MAELSLFGYCHGRTFAHCLDVRCKLACLLMLTSAVMTAAPAVMGPLSFGAILLWTGLRLPLKRFGRELTVFLLFLTFVFSTRAVSTSGDPWLSLGVLQVTREGVWEGGQMVWRLLMIMVLGLIFITTTRPADLKAAVQWLLRPIPLVPEQKAATMVGLLVRFIPVLHQQIQETRSALAARGAVARRPSLRQIRTIIWPTMRRVVLAADQLSLAMMARGYKEKRTEADFYTGPAEILALISTGAILVGTLIV